MKQRSLTKLAIITIILISVSIFPAMAADEESLGRAAEQEGKLRQALTHYVEALKTDENNLQLREKIIKIAQKLQPPLIVPEEAEKYLARGEAAIETANDEQDYTRAAKEFKSALKIAPWFIDAYFNLGVVLDKAGKYDEAINNLNLYLIAVPNDKDAKKLKYKVEYRQEEVKRVKGKEREAETASAARSELFQSLGGTFVPEQGAPMAWALDLEVRNERFTLKSIGIYWKGKIEPKAAKNQFEGTIGDDLSLRGEYIQDFIDGWEKNANAPSGYASKSFSYNKRSPMTGQVSRDGQSLVLQFTRHNYHHPTREGGGMYDRKLELRMRRMR